MSLSDIRQIRIFKIFIFKDKQSLYFDLIIICLVIACALGLHCKHHTIILMNKFDFIEYKRDIEECFGLYVT